VFLLRYKTLGYSSNLDATRQENLTGTASSSPTTEAARKRARKATVAADEPMGRSGVETDQEGGDEADEELRFTKVRRVLFRASDLLPSSPAARSGSRARADEEDIGSDDAGLEAEVWTPSPGEDGTASADGLQALFPTTQLCFDDEVGPGRIWTPVNLRGDADPHWREVPHNPDHPVSLQSALYPAPSDGYPAVIGCPNSRQAQATNHLAPKPLQMATTQPTSSVSL
jgi:hypothetical protein